MATEPLRKLGSSGGREVAWYGEGDRPPDLTLEGLHSRISLSVQRLDGKRTARYEEDDVRRQRKARNALTLARGGRYAFRVSGASCLSMRARRGIRIASCSDIHQSQSHPAPVLP